MKDIEKLLSSKEFKEKIANIRNGGKSTAKIRFTEQQYSEIFKIAVKKVTDKRTV